MNGIIVLIVIWAISKVLKGAKGGKKAANAGKRTASSGTGQTRQDISGTAQEIIDEAVRKAKIYRSQSGPGTASASANGVPGADVSWLLDSASCEGPQDAHEEGVSHMDDSCLGGSLPHETHEGPDSFTETRPSNLRQPETARVQSLTKKARYTAADMRRAIVTSEILREPVALRRRTVRR